MSFFYDLFYYKMSRRRQKGKGPVLDWIKKTARNVHDYVKDKKLISRGLSGLAALGTPYSSHFKNASEVASTMGYGRHRKPGPKKGSHRRPGRPRKHKRR